MSRIGKKPVQIPEGVVVKVSGNSISVKGPRGALAFDFHGDVKVDVAQNEARVFSARDTKQARSLWGLTRVLVANMVEGVTKGYEKQLELQGVGFRMAVQGRKLNMALGFSHPVEIEIPEGIEVKIEKNTMTIAGIDKQKVGQFAATIRALKKAEPYKGKGFRYAGEIVRRKVGKKAVGAEK